MKINLPSVTNFELAGIQNPIADKFVKIGRAHV